MAKRKRKQKGSLTGILLTLLITALAALGVFLGPELFDKDPAAPVSGGEVQFHFIDVG